MSRGRAIPARDARLALSTVYRTFDLLRRERLIRKLRLGEGHHYECCPAVTTGTVPKSMHFHVTCRTCRTVVEFQSPHLDRLQRDLQGRCGLTSLAAGSAVPAGSSGWPLSPHLPFL